MNWNQREKRRPLIGQMSGGADFSGAANSLRLRRIQCNNVAPILQVFYGLSSEAQMSIESIAVVWKMQIKNPTTKYVLVAMANFADKAGRNIFPATETVSEITSLCEKTVRRHVNQLVKMGLLIPDGVSQYKTKRFVIPMSDWTFSPTTPDFQSQERDSESTNPSTVNKPSSAASASQVPSIIGVASPASIMATNVANSASLESETTQPQVTVAKLDAATDIFTHAVKAKTAAALIQRWKLPAHLEDLCVTFADVFGIVADGPTPTITARSKAKWLGSAAQLHEIHPTRAELVKARDAAAGKFPISHPGAAVNTIINMRAMNPKPPALAHLQPVTFREAVNHDDE